MRRAMSFPSKRVLPAPMASGVYGGDRGRNFTIFFFNDTATTEIYTLPLPDALPISADPMLSYLAADLGRAAFSLLPRGSSENAGSGEHTSEIQAPDKIVCRLLL